LQFDFMAMNAMAVPT